MQRSKATFAQTCILKSPVKTKRSTCTWRLLTLANISGSVCPASLTPASSSCLIAAADAARGVVAGRVGRGGRRHRGAEERLRAGGGVEPRHQRRARHRGRHAPRRPEPQRERVQERARQTQGVRRVRGSESAWLWAGRCLGRARGAGGRGVLGGAGCWFVAVRDKIGTIVRFFCS